jgi:hypothetical protein
MSSKYARTVIVLLFVAMSGFLLKAPQGFKFALDMGYYLRDTGRPAASIPFFYVASVNNPQSHLPHWGLGTMLVDVGLRREAPKHLLRATQLKREWSRATYTAYIATRHGDLKTVKEALAIGREDNAIETEKYFYTEYMTQPWYFDNLQQLKRALAVTEVLIKAEPELVTWFELRRQLWGRYGWYIQQKAVSVVESRMAQNTLMELQTEDAHELANSLPGVKQAKMSFVYAGRAALKAGRYQEARDWFVAGAKHDYALMEERISSEFVLRDDQTFDKALAQSDGLIRVDPQNNLWWKMRFNFWRYQYTTTVVGLDKADQDIAVRKLYDKQLADANSLVAAYPDNKLALQHRVFVLFANGKNAEARQDLTAVDNLEKKLKQKIN